MLHFACTFTNSSLITFQDVYILPVYLVCAPLPPRFLREKKYGLEVLKLVDFVLLTPSSQAKCPILAYSNLPLGRIHLLFETSNRRALSLASTDQIAPYRYIHFKYCWPQWQAVLVACAMVFCLEKKRERFLA
jgi:hypothetical protein